MAAVPIPLLFAALTGRSGHGLAPYGPRCPTYSLGLLELLFFRAALECQS